MTGQTEQCQVDHSEHEHGLGRSVHQRRDFFTRFAAKTARLTGTATTFSIAVGVILVWAITGPLFKFSDTWQLVINTGTTIVTFLMVFLIQNTQNRESEALHLKIDALIIGNHRARNTLIELEDLTQQELDALKARFADLARRNHNEPGEDRLEDYLEEEDEAGKLEIEKPETPSVS